MPTRLARSAGLTGYLDLARSMGLDPYRLAASEGLPGACLTDPDSSQGSGRSDRPAAGDDRPGAPPAPRTSASRPRRDTAPVQPPRPIGLVAREQPTVRAAIATIIHSSWLQNEALSWRLEDAGDLTIMRLGIAADRRAGRQATELTIGVTVRILRGLLGERWRPEAVVFQHPSPERLAAHRRVLGVMPAFGHDFTGIILLTRHLAASIVSADPETARQLQRYVDQLAIGRRADPAAAARELVRALLPTGGCAVDRVAALMGVDRRTLHRRLARQGATFTGLVEEVRREVAGAHLAAGDRSLTEIADLLGYSSLSAFSRWRRRSRGGPRPSA